MYYFGAKIQITIQFGIFDREIAQALAVLQVAIVSIDFKRFVYTDLDD